MPRRREIKDVQIADEQPGERASGRPGRFSYEGLDRVLHEKARLGILASLAAHGGGLLFNDLKKMCSLTDGNLSRHLAVLIESKLVEVGKGVRGSRDQTAYRLTATGRRRFSEYIGVLESVVADAQKSRSGLRAADASWSPG